MDDPVFSDVMAGESHSGCQRGRSDGMGHLFGKFQERGMEGGRSAREAREKPGPELERLLMEISLMESPDWKKLFSSPIYRVWRASKIRSVHAASQAPIKHVARIFSYMESLEWQPGGRFSINFRQAAEQCRLPLAQVIAVCHFL